MSEFRRYLRISAHLQEIAAACDFVVDAARSAGFDDTALHHCRLAVDEACTNIIEHGYAGSADDSAPIEITVRFTAGELVIEIVDRSPAFDPLSQPEPDLQSFLDDINPGGWGVFFIRKVMDRVEYHHADGRNHLTMTKRLRNPANSGSPPLRIAEQHTTEGRIAQLILTGTLDMAGSALLEKRLQELFERGSIRVVLSLEGVTLVTSGALKMLVGMWQRARELRGDIVLAAPNEPARDALSATGLDLIFTVTRTVKAATAHFQQGNQR